MRTFKSVAKFALCSLFGFLLSSQTVLANDSFYEAAKSSVEVMKYSKDLKVRGFKINKGMYFGQAKVAGKYGVGLVVEKRSFAWGINNRGISISKRF